MIASVAISVAIRISPCLMLTSWRVSPRTFDINVGIWRLILPLDTLRSLCLVLTWNRAVISRASSLPIGGGTALPICLVDRSWSRILAGKVIAAASS